MGKKRKQPTGALPFCVVDNRAPWEPAEPHQLDLFATEPAELLDNATAAAGPRQRVVDGRTLQMIRGLARQLGLRFGLVRGDFATWSAELVEAIDAARAECDQLVAIVHGAADVLYPNAHLMPKLAPDKRASMMASLRAISWAHVPKRADATAALLDPDVIFAENLQAVRRPLAAYRCGDVRPLFPDHHVNRHAWARRQAAA